MDFDQAMPANDRSLYNQEQMDYVNGIKDEDLRSHLLHQIRQCENMRQDRDNFERRINQLKLNDKVVIDLQDFRNDKSEGSYYYSWQANIAMSILDQLVDEKLLMPGSRLYTYFHEAANNGAKRFLDQLCHNTTTEKEGQ